MSSTAEKQRNNEDLLAINATLETEIAELKYQVGKLQHENELLRIARFGQKSERFVNPDQQDLFAEDDLPPFEAPPEEAEKEDIRYTRQKPKRRNLKEISESGKYPTEQVIHDINEDDKQCGECDKALSVIGEDKTYMLDHIPAQIKIIEHVKLKYACKCCEGNVKMAELPKFPIAKSMAMPSLLAYTLVAADKYMYQLYCMAHARRKFVEVVKLAKSKGLAHVALKMITELYKIEREARKQGLTPDERYALRQEKSKPIMDKLKSWLDEHIQTILPKSPTGKAMGYMLKHWEGLYRYLESGHVEIDNNGVENVIRPLALGRKNYLFMGSPGGADTAANIYSLLATCKANNIDPYKYFKKMLENIRYCETEEDYRQLLPQNIAL